MNREKKRELATYAKLGLSRRHKSRRYREAVASGGRYRFIGGTDPDRPWVRVEAAEYAAAWQAAAAALDWPRRTDAERDALRPRLEQMVYDRLVASAVDARRLEQEFEKTHGRAMTEKERLIYARVRAEASVELTPEERARRLRTFWARGVMAQIRRRQDEHPRRLQEVWAAVVGAEAAMQTTLESYDAARGVAFCSSLSSVVAHALRRRPGLAEKLSAALGVKITRVVFR